MIAAKSLNLGVADIKVKLGDSVRLGNLKIGTDFGHADEHLLLQGSRRQAGLPGGFLLRRDQRQDSLCDKYKDKIVLIGPTAAGSAASSSRRCRRPCRRC
jgi:hypothetical protein